MIVVRTAQEFEPEVQWVMDVILKDFLGLEYQLALFDEKEYFQIDVGKHKILIRNIFLLSVHKDWLSCGFSFTTPLQTIRLPDHLEGDFLHDELPVLFGVPNLVRTGDVIEIQFDLIGSIFLMLSGYEDAVSHDIDEHGRLNFSHSIISKLDLVSRPFVDESVDVLWKILSHCDPGLSRKILQSNFEVSCDVDVPYSFYVKSFYQSLRVIGGDLIKRRNPILAFRTAVNFAMSQLGIYKFDPMNKFDWMMELNERLGHRITFYFIAGKSSLEMDGHYSLDEKRVRCLIKKVYDRGHEVGMHASYNSRSDRCQISTEASKLRAILSDLGINQPLRKNRQHYLRFSRLETFAHLESVGIECDSTVGFAQCIGFRCGTSRPFRIYDLSMRRPLKIRQAPLLVMDNTLLSDSYMGMEGVGDILPEIKRIKYAVDFFGGSFSLLWHNSTLDTPSLRRLYSEIVRLF